MSIRIRTPSLFRPSAWGDRTMIKESGLLVEHFNRRGVLRGGLTFGALTLLKDVRPSRRLVETSRNGGRAALTLR
jgi:hypothetical protein